jgi:hypothetical protein
MDGRRINRGGGAFQQSQGLEASRCSRKRHERNSVKKIGKPDASKGVAYFGVMETDFSTKKWTYLLEYEDT